MFIGKPVNGIEVAVDKSTSLEPCRGCDSDGKGIPPRCSICGTSTVLGLEIISP